MNGDQRQEQGRPALELAISFTLVGLLILGALFYYKAVRLQRFLEPALAVFQPQVRFSKTLQDYIDEEFGNTSINGLKIAGNSIWVRTNLIGGDSFHGAKPVIMQKVGNVLLKVLSDPWMKSNMDFVLVSNKTRIGTTPEEHKQLRHDSQAKAEAALEALFHATPALKEKFQVYFTSASFPAQIAGDEQEWVAFHILPSERLHIEVLYRFYKYAQ